MFKELWSFLVGCVRLTKCANSYILVQLEILEYIHEHEYVHADIKASNLMLGFSDPSQVSTVMMTAGLGFCPQPCN